MIRFQRANLASKKCWFHFFSLLIIYAFLARDFFVLGNYYADPWCHLADADAAFAPQTILLLNDGDIYFTHHPGATVYSLQGVVHRVFALFNNEHRKLMQLSEISSPEEVESILSTAVKTGRIIALLTIAALASIIYFLILRFTGNWAIAFIFTFFIALSKGVLFHAHAIRAEGLSLTFFYIAVLLCAIGLTNKGLTLFKYAAIFLLSGLATGLSVLSKIQILPAVILLLFAILSAAWFIPNFCCTHKINIRHSIHNVILSFCLVMLNPYWALVRPVFLTPEQFNLMDKNTRAIYGSLPEDFSIPVLAILTVLLALSIALTLIKPQAKAVWYKSFAISLTINSVALGVIISAYIALLPVSPSFNAYVTNTNHLVYSTLTNLSSGGGGFLLNLEGAFFDRINQVIDQNRSFSAFATINVLYLAGIASIISSIRLIAEKTEEKLAYLLTLGLFAAGYGMDVVGTLRMKVPYSVYAIYSVGFYGLGLAYFTSLEFQSALKSETLIQFIKSGSRVTVVAIVVLIGGVLNVGMTGYSILSSSSGAGREAGDSEATAWSILNSYLPQFQAIMRYADLKRKVCSSSNNPRNGKDCGFPLGVRGWLDAVHESLRERRTPYEMAGGEVVNGWWLLGYDVNGNKSPELKIYWSPPPGAEPQAAIDFYQETGVGWTQVVRQAGPLVHWQGPDVVEMNDLKKNASPLELQGNVGNFIFNYIENNDTIRVTPVFSDANTTDMVIQFGFSGDRGKEGLGICGGQAVVFSVWARVLEPPVDDGAALFIQDKADAYLAKKTPIASTMWRKYAVFRKIRDDATNIAGGIYWRPKSSQDWLEFKDLRVSVFDINHSSGAAHGLKVSPPLRPLKTLEALPFR